MICAIVAAFAQASLVPLGNRSSRIAFCICVFLAQQSFAQELCFPNDPLGLASTPPPTGAPIALDDDIVVRARDFFLDENSDLQFSNGVEIDYGTGKFVAERGRYDEDGGNFEALGRVTFTDPDVTVFAEDALVDTDGDTISFSQAGFEMPKRPARGSADDLLIQSSDSTMSAKNLFFTTCPIENTSWVMRAKGIEFDVNAGLGTARGVKLNFKGVPILYAPYFTFPIDNQRKSGFLTPDISDRERTGFDLSVPYYLNLAPNYDLTLEPRYMSKRGTQLRSNFRYLLLNSEGEMGWELLPEDDETGTTRRYVNLAHESQFTEHWELLAGIEEVSDETYFEDLGTTLAVTSQTHLDRFVDIEYHAPYWSVLTRLQNYQTIDATLTDEERPYERVPQILFGGRWFGRLVGFDSSTELVNFDRNVGVTGWRADSTQELSLRFARSGMYLTPAVALRHTNYWTDDPTTGTEDTLRRALPVSSLDTGMKFERDAGRSANWIHTLEPRLLYVHAPFENQDDLPVFDTILPDFNLVQLFRKYQFVGPDRITDTDQLSFGFTTRLIDAVNGRERLTATLGQTRYLSEQHVSLPGEIPNAANASDYVAETSIGLANAWNLDVGYQWNSDTHATARAETRFEYRPKEDRLFGFGYRYRPGLLEQGDLSFVWPAADRWRIIGRYSYSFLEEEPLEQFVGWEYEACCWRFRMVGRRYVSRSTGEADSAISIQLELKGLSQSQRTAEELLDRGILGYRSFATPNQPP
jgi:LPS-assembly protein